MTAETSGCDWLRGAVIYHVLIDRFAGCTMSRCDGGEFAGGNLRDLAGRLDHLIELGAGVLWISPFCRSESYHGYDVTDFFAVDGRFGTMDDLAALLAACRERSLRVIADFVPNHCSSRHPFFVEAQRDAGSVYRRWFHFKGGGADRYATFMGHRHLPKLNLRCAAARRHIIDAALFWLEKGIDGYRLDHVIGQGHDFWRALRSAVKDDFPQAALIGEALFFGYSLKGMRGLCVPGRYRRWVGNRLGFLDGIESAMRAYVGVLNGCLDFTFQRIILESLRKPLNRPAAAELAREELAKHDARYPRGFLLPSLIESHDCNRFLYEFRGEESRANLEAAVRLQMQSAQPAVIYYGTEVGMTQERGVGEQADQGDTLARQPMIWDELRQDREVFEMYRRYIRERRERFGAAGGARSGR